MSVAHVFCLIATDRQEGFAVVPETQKLSHPPALCAPTFEALPTVLCFCKVRLSQACPCSVH